MYNIFIISSFAHFSPLHPCSPRKQTNYAINYLHQCVQRARLYRQRHHQPCSSQHLWVSQNLTKFGLHESDFWIFYRAIWILGIAALTLYYVVALKNIWDQMAPAPPQQEGK